MFGKTTIKFQQWIVLSASALVLLLALVFLGTVFGKFRETAQRGATDRFELITQGIAEHLQLSLDAHARRASALRPVFIATIYFGALLFPVLGFFSVFFFRYSFVGDHFQYLASMGPLALAGAGLSRGGGGGIVRGGMMTGGKGVGEEGCVHVVCVGVCCTCKVHEAHVPTCKHSF